MKKKYISLLLAVVAGLAVALGLTLGSASAAPTVPAPIVGYDVEQTPASGWGCWSYTYTGYPASTYRTIPGTPVCGSNELMDLWGGSAGTLNDGIYSTSTSNNELFYIGPATDGLPVQPRITLHLASTVRVQEIRLYGGNVQLNINPGALDGATVEIGGRSLHLNTIPTGWLNFFGTPVDDLLVLRGTPLADIPTDTIVLRDFSASWAYGAYQQFSITEITVTRALTAEEQLASLRDAVQAINARQGIVNSLDGKLAALGDAMTALNAGSRNDACNKLLAFENEVEAQSGKALTIEQANSLLDAAHELEATLGCSA